MTPETLKVADNATLILPLHSELDAAREDSVGVNIGTTRRGIGPAYEDKVGRRGIRVCDLDDLPALRLKVHTLLAHHNALRIGFGQSAIDEEEVLSLLQEVAPRIRPFVAPVWQLLDQARERGDRILFEGAQGAMLDVDHGTYPFVTSSNTMAGQIAVGSGVGPGAVGYILGITKAYTTRVGEGPFPTELHDDIGQGLGERGAEFGSVTGRARRCGWFDAVMVRQAIVVGGIEGIALTKLDVLDGMPELKVCIGYQLEGETIHRFPAGMAAQARVTPVFETMEGWSESTRGARSWADLPANSVKYIRRIEELIGAPVAMLSTSPERDDTILVRNPFAD